MFIAKVKNSCSSLSSKLYLSSIRYLYGLSGNPSHSRYFLEEMLVKFSFLSNFNYQPALQHYQYFNCRFLHLSLHHSGGHTPGRSWSGFFSSERLLTAINWQLHISTEYHSIMIINLLIWTSVLFLSAGSALQQLMSIIALVLMTLLHVELNAGLCSSRDIALSMDLAEPGDGNDGMMFVLPLQLPPRLHWKYCDKCRIFQQ